MVVKRSLLLWPSSMVAAVDENKAVQKEVGHSRPQGRQKKRTGLCIFKEQLERAYLEKKRRQSGAKGEPVNCKFQTGGFPTRHKGALQRDRCLGVGAPLLLDLF